ncbi:hypothetical protein Goklo_010679 [Gossypium klotzschianum]|uniref:ABC transporter domain-containing protein n=1 Tax=Gossypium klotzschianum TaxID=34286 RepID=A0A7J8V6R6_9ROSI|nr:hypothetical protein [Gossypium klotzschianum]
MTLVLGPPGAGKTTFLQALAGRLDQDLRSSGRITYCGYEMSEFIPQRTCAYIGHHDVHHGEMTVRETLDFSGRCLGVGTRYEILKELSKREKEAGIKPDPEIDAFMKAIAMAGQRTSLVTDYVLKILGLEMCSDTLVGDDMRRGISGGEKKRLTTGEMLVGPAKAFFMDEISTGLDSSTTYQICKFMRQMVHIMDVTMVISLLQPAPETYDQFDHLILLSEGQIVYQGPTQGVLEFFEYMGFKCPERKGVADFLQEVTSKKDQQQYWFRKDQPYSYVTVSEFVQGFNSFHIGQQLESDLRVPYDRSVARHPALVTEKYGISNWQLFRACFAREWLLMKRNSFVYIFKTVQITIMSLIAMTVFFIKEMHAGDLEDGSKFFGALFYSLINVMFNGMAELAMTIFRLPVFYKQRDFLFYPPWAFSLSIWIIKIPLSLLESGIWICLTYYTIGFAPAASRFIAAVGRTQVIANTLGTFTLLMVFVLGGFIVARALRDSKAIVVDENENTNKKESSSGKNIPGTDLPVRNSLDATNITGRPTGRGMVLPFKPLSLAFNHVSYSVDMPSEMKSQGVEEDHLKLLRNVSGAFRPGILTALVGVTGAGKTTLMDVLAGRKTEGYIEGNISVSGYPKNQATFTRVSGYCEQNDIHSPHVTVYESLLYSAWLRLSSEVDTKTRKMFIEEVMELIELKPLRGAIVGLPGVDGLSTEQRKRLTIAVELVANPSIIFMDEPTSGLDARAAAIVMRTVRNTVDTGRTVVCTIHQPSIDIFESFDELLLMKRGGQIIYAGPLGRNSHNLVQYFEAIPGVPKIKEGYNPATWMLEITAPAVENQLNADFAEIYAESSLYQRNQEIIEELSRPVPGSEDLHFPTKYSLPFLSQCKVCFLKQHWSYKRNPRYNAIRFFITIVVGILFGLIFWNKGQQIAKQQDVLNFLGAMYSAVFFLGAVNASTVQGVVAVERTVFYRERAAGMYSEFPYALAQVKMINYVHWSNLMTEFKLKYLIRPSLILDLESLSPPYFVVQVAIEIIYTAIQTAIYVALLYLMIGYEWKASNFLWFYYYITASYVYFTLYGMMVIALTPGAQVAAIVMSFFLSLWNIFSGFLIPRPLIPVWWRWYYWATPVAWTLYGLITSQLGDRNSDLEVPGFPDIPVKRYIKEMFGFEYEFLPVVAVVHIGWCLLFFFVFAYGIKFLNFQRR